MRRRIFIIILIAAFRLVNSSMSSAQYYGTELPFVLGSGARSSTMGVAGAAFDGDASVQYRNPSALSFLEWKQLAFFRTVLFDAKSTYHSLSYAHPFLGYGTFGVNIMRLDVSGIEERNYSNQLLSNDLHNSQTRLLLGFGRQISSSIAAGLNIKIDNQSLGSFSGSGVGLDIGITAVQHPSIGRYIKAFYEGLVIQNLIEPSIKLDQEKVSDPMQFSLGFSSLSVIHNLHLLTSIDFVNPRYSPFTIRFAQALSYGGHYSFRFGMDRISPTYGLGAGYKNLSFDYAYRSEDLGRNHRFSISVRFGSSLQEQKTRIRTSLEKEVNDRINKRMNEFESRQINQALTKGDSLYYLGLYGEALQYFEAAMLWDPENEHAKDLSKKCKFKSLLDQAESAFKAKDYGRALLFYKEGLEVIPEDSTALDMIDLCNKEIAASQDLSDQIDRVLKTSIDYYAERRYAEALSGFEEVLRLDPGNKMAEEYKEKVSNNISAVVKQLTIDSRILMEKGNYKDALNLLNKAQVYQPDNLYIRNEMTRLKQELSKKQSSTRKPAKLVQKQTRIEKKPAVDSGMLEQKYNQGMKSFKNGDFEKAIRVFTEVWTADPSFHNVSDFLTKAYLFMGMRRYTEEKYVQAMDLWKKVLSIDPSNQKAIRYLKKTREEFEKLSGS